MISNFQRTVMEILDGSPRQTLSRYVEWLITAVVLINCSAVIQKKKQTARFRHCLRAGEKRVEDAKLSRKRSLQNIGAKSKRADFALAA